MMMNIKLDDLTHPDIARLLAEHLDDMKAISPPESVHALDLEELRTPDISFWSIWDGDRLAGCGAIKELDPRHGEIKSMRTASQYRNRGIASSLLQHIIAEAHHRGYQRLSLETGSMDFFTPAHQLYKKHGFEFCMPFGNYQEDPNSLFMSRVLEGSGTIEEV